MPWITSVTIDSDQPDVGTASATYTDPVLGPFVYSRRAKINVQDGGAFVAEAIAARDVWQAKSAQNSNAAAWVLTQLNSTDPKAGV